MSTGETTIDTYDGGVWTYNDKEWNALDTGSDTGNKIAADGTIYSHGIDQGFVVQWMAGLALQGLSNSSRGLASISSLQLPVPNPNITHYVSANPGPKN